ncbi:MAG: hypothetical protein EPO21_05175 [Chloroflexota bacterium]|nr:MAG: hypothetical protein EPO21_05175 [Chloroflexota bacterium]
MDVASPQATLAERVNTGPLARRVAWQTIVFVAMVLAVVGFAVILRIAFGPHIREDAYITLRYAANIATGQGFIFNPGEHVLGTTTPLYTLILAALIMLGTTPPTTTAVAIGIAADAAAMIVLAVLAARFLRRPGVILVLLCYALLSPLVSWAVSGMETSLYTLLILASVLAYVAGKMRLAGLLTALVVLTRPDGAILAAVLVLHGLVWRRRGLIGATVVFAGVLAPWLVFALIYFGSPFPQSVAAKMYHTVSDPFLSLRNTVWYFSDTENRWFLPLTLVFVLGVYHSRRDRGMRLLTAWAFAYSAAFLISNKFLFPQLTFEWYFVPLLAPYAIGIGAGLDGLALAVARLPHANRAATRLGVVIAVALVFLVGYLAVLRFQHSELGRLVGGREEVYGKLAERLVSMGVRDEPVAAYEIGAFAYYYPGPILDLWGLVSPEVVGKDSAVTLETYRPAWIMTYEDLLPPEVRGANWFQREYKSVYALGTWEGRRTTLYRRYALPASGGPSWSPGEAVLGDSMQLLSMNVETTAQGDGQKALHVTLVWKALSQMSRHYTVFVHLLDANGKPIGQHDGEPQGNEHPTTRWQIGERIVDKHDLVVDALALNGETTLVIGAYETRAVDSLLSWSSPTVPEWPHELRVPLAALDVRS